MAAATKTTSGTVVHPDTRFTSLSSLTDPLQLSPAVEGRVEPYELVELFYGSNTTSPATHASQLSPRSAGTSSPEIMQVIEQAVKEKLHPDSYTCEVCGRNFREASHFTKHKRGALCRKLAQRMAKKTKKKKGSGNQDSTEKRSKQTILHKPYQCNVCGAKFCDKVNVELHLERQHNSRQQLWVEIAKNGGFSCAECDRWFQDKGELVEHQRQHMATYLHHTERLNHGGEPQSATVVYYHDPLQQVQTYGQQTQPPPPPPPHLPPPAPPPMAHMHTNMTTILHTPQLAPSLIPVTQPSNSQPPLSTLPGIPSIGVIESVAKGLKNNKTDRLPANSKWNICGDCGHKFVDPMNLELHIQRKHPDSYMIETINLGGGTILYKTNNTRSDVQCLITQNGTNSDLKSNKTNPQTFECILCGYKATSKNYILFHLQNIHSTSNTEFIHILETLESGKKGARGLKGRKGAQDPLLREQRHVCNACGEVFLSKAELIRHRIKDKQYMCGVCCHASCSQQQVTTHMATHHPHHHPSVSGGLSCWICGCISVSAASLDDHLGTHGTITAECVSCGECGVRLGALLPHVGVHLPRQSTRIRLTVSRPGQPSSSHTFEVAVDGTIHSGLNLNRTSPISVEAVPTRIAPAYACSECGACLAGAAQLEAHLQLHQLNTVVTTQAAVSSSNNSGTFTSTIATMVPVSSSLPQVTGTSVGDVCRVPGSFEFRCEECGFWRQESEPVMRHIQAVHMSGNMLHSVKLQSGLVQIHPIHVVTPISSLSSQ
ncbi:zinc finger protein 628-like [Homarus americanus]|uniref:Zinc finger protein 260-like n=1 Tax=Homarus americanus TaxID=6706 RepID=A0A8J5MXE0_HOMAM|nr:zinc finger protein 628-like [Homarus americanus]KAG7168035.1 Zinc finger protein 260-like [Homarus americanus]